MAAQPVSISQLLRRPANTSINAANRYATTATRLNIGKQVKISPSEAAEPDRWLKAVNSPVQKVASPYPYTVEQVQRFAASGGGKSFKLSDAQTAEIAEQYANIGKPITPGDIRELIRMYEAAKVDTTAVQKEISKRVAAIIPKTSTISADQLKTADAEYQSVVFQAAREKLASQAAKVAAEKAGLQTISKPQVTTAQEGTTYGVAIAAAPVVNQQGVLSSTLAKLPSAQVPQSSLVTRMSVVLPNNQQIYVDASGGEVSLATLEKQLSSAGYGNLNTALRSYFGSRKSATVDEIKEVAAGRGQKLVVQGWLGDGVGWLKDRAAGAVDFALSEDPNAAKYKETVVKPNLEKLKPAEPKKTTSSKVEDAKKTESPAPTTQIVKAPTPTATLGNLFKSGTEQDTRIRKVTGSGPIPTASATRVGDWAINTQQYDWLKKQGISDSTIIAELNRGINPLSSRGWSPFMGGAPAVSEAPVVSTPLKTVSAADYAKGGFGDALPYLTSDRQVALIDAKAADEMRIANPLKYRSTLEAQVAPDLVKRGLAWQDIVRAPTSTLESFAKKESAAKPMLASKVSTQQYVTQSLEATTSPSETLTWANSGLIDAVYTGPKAREGVWNTISGVLGDSLYSLSEGNWTKAVVENRDLVGFQNTPAGQAIHDQLFAEAMAGKKPEELSTVVTGSGTALPRQMSMEFLVFSSTPEELRQLAQKNPVVISLIDNMYATGSAYIREKLGDKEVEAAKERYVQQTGGKVTDSEDFYSGYRKLRGASTFIQGIGGSGSVPGITAVAGILPAGAIGKTAKLAGKAAGFADIISDASKTAKTAERATAGGVLDNLLGRAQGSKTAAVTSGEVVTPDFKAAERVIKEATQDASIVRSGERTGGVLESLLGKSPVQERVGAETLSALRAKADSPTLRAAAEQAGLPSIAKATSIKGAAQGTRLSSSSDTLKALKMGKPQKTVSQVAEAVPPSTVKETLEAAAEDVITKFPDELKPTEPLVPGGKGTAGDYTGGGGGGGYTQPSGGYTQPPIIPDSPGVYSPDLKTVVRNGADGSLEAYDETTKTWMKVDDYLKLQDARKPKVPETPKAPETPKTPEEPVTTYSPELGTIVRQKADGTIEAFDSVSGSWMTIDDYANAKAARSVTPTQPISTQPQTPVQTYIPTSEVVRMPTTEVVDLSKVAEPTVTLPESLVTKISSAKTDAELLGEFARAADDNALDLASHAENLMAVAIRKAQSGASADEVLALVDQAQTYRKMAADAANMCYL